MAPYHLQVFIMFLMEWTLVVGCVPCPLNHLQPGECTWVWHYIWHNAYYSICILYIIKLKVMKISRSYIMYLNFYIDQSVRYQSEDYQKYYHFDVLFTLRKMTSLMVITFKILIYVVQVANYRQAPIIDISEA